MISPNLGLTHKGDQPLAKLMIPLPFKCTDCHMGDLSINHIYIDIYIFMINILPLYILILGSNILHDQFTLW